MFLKPLLDETGGHIDDCQYYHEFNHVFDCHIRPRIRPAAVCAEGGGAGGFSRRIGKRSGCTPLPVIPLVGV